MLLEVKNLKIRYALVDAVKGVSLGVEEGHVVTLIGANGAGKSTMLKSLSGIVRPYAGEIWFRGQRVDGWKPAKIVRTGIAQVPEGGSLSSERQRKGKKRLRTCFQTFPYSKRKIRAEGRDFERW